MDKEALSSQLRGETAEANWEMLRSHFARGAVRLVDETLDLNEVGVCIACDDTTQIKEWLAEEKIHEPTLDQVAMWETSPPDFLSVVVAPFVLIQHTHKNKTGYN